MKRALFPLFGWIWADVVRSEETVESSFESVEGDPETLRAIVGQEGVRTDWPEPGFNAYSQDVGQTIATTLEGWLYRFGTVVDLGALIQGVASILLVLALTALTFFLLSHLFSLSKTAPLKPVRAAAIDEGETVRLSSAQWQERLDTQLSAGQATEALESLWWWLASLLLPDRADPSWTSRELLRRSQRNDLLPQIRRLDALLYGHIPPTLDDVRELRLALNNAWAASRGTESEAIEPGGTE